MTTVSWESVLDGLEAAVIVGEQTVLTGATLTDLTPWEPPADLGPIPAELRDRARELAERQQSVLADLPAAMAKVQRQLDLTHRITEATAERRPAVYIDQRA